MIPTPSYAANTAAVAPCLSALRCLTLSVAALSCLTGCGYHTAGSATHIPGNVRTIAVPIFTTHVQAYHSELTLTQAVIRELNTRTRYRVLTQNSADADALLSGTVLTQTVVPLNYDSTSGETASYLITLTVKVILTAHDGHVLYQNDALSYKEEYQSTQDLTGFIREDPAAIARLSRNLSQALVSDMLESF
jgi:outer membrane lipopolysaccharide assembly protein LptE/RlpB